MRQFSKFEIVHRPISSPLRAVRSRLGLGTCLSGAAAALLLGAVPAQAQDAAPTLTLRAPHLAQPSVRFHPRAAEQLPQDLTRLAGERFTPLPAIAATNGIMVSRSSNAVAPAPSGHFFAVADPTIAAPQVSLVSGGDVVIEDGDIATTGDSRPGVDSAATGTTSITVGNISTQGGESGGIHAYGYGDMTINAGDISTQGYGAGGIDATTNVGGYSGGIVINAGNIETTGSASSGVRASAYNGAVAVTVGAVRTGGDASDGIYAWSYNHDATIDASSVDTSGTGSRGIVAYSGGTTRVTVDTVTTTGESNSSWFDSGGIKVVGAAVDVHAGTVSTTGDYSAGIYANSNLVHDNGQYDRHINVEAGTVTTLGFGSDGIDAINTAAGGLTTVTVDKVTTSGDQSNGVFAFAPQGEVSVNAGSIETGGARSLGILAASYYANVAVHADSVTTAGQDSIGVYSYAGGRQYSRGMTNSVDVGSVKTSGDGAIGIETISLGQRIDTTITAGGVETQGYGATGIRAIADGQGNNITIHAASVSAGGTNAYGIQATNYSLGGKLDISADKVTTSGDLSAGVFGFAVTGDVHVSVGEVTTSGLYSFGVKLGDQYGDVHLDAGKVTTTGDGAWGIYASSGKGNVSVDATNVTTSGNGAAGVVARSFYGNVDVHADNITASGNLATAIDAYSYLGLGDVNVTASNIKASGYSKAIFAGGHSVTVTTSGTIEKSGSYAAITAVARGGDLTINNSATITTTNGDGPYGATLGHGIYAVGIGNVDVTINSTGKISTEGFLSYGISASSYGGAITITQSDITTSGRAGHGVVAVTSSKTGYQANDGAGGITLSVGSIATTGYDSVGILASDNTKLGSVLATVTGDITTTQGFSHGMSLYSANQTAEARLHTVSTQGYYAQGVHLNGHKDVLHFDGSISTAGVISNAVVAYAGNGGIEISGSGPITTTGSYFSSGIRASSPGDIKIDIDGLISTEGRGSSAIEVTERKRHSEVQPYDPPADEEAGPQGLANGFPVPKPRIPETAATGSTISITASAIKTAGANSDGILASTTTGDVEIMTGDVAATGTGSIGIFAEGRNLTADTGNTSSAQATAIALQSYEGAALTVNGAVRGGTNGVLLQGYGTSLTVAKGASITGGNNGVVIDATPHVTPIVHYWGYAPEYYVGQDEPQPLPPINPAAGTAKLVNAGTISAGTGYAVTVTGGGVDVKNSGVVIGAVKFSSFADTFTNSGQFIATKDSDFGGGGDTFVNSGTLSIARPQMLGTGGMAVSLLGLAQFQNTGGIIDLRNSTGGDVLTLPGAYVGSNGARLGLDVAAGGADKLVIGGAATGTTSVVLNVTPEGAHLLSQPLMLVQTGAGSSANAFVVVNNAVGLVRYALAFNAATGSFGLTSQAGVPVYRLLKLEEGAQTIWNQSADAWSSHMADLRDTDEPASRVWGQAFGGVQNRDSDRTIGGTRFSLDYRQDFYGGQAGYDIGGRQGDTSSFVFGATAGYLSSHLNFRGAGTRVGYDAVNLGGYAGFRSGPFFANLLGQYDHYWMGVRDRVAGWSDNVGGNAFGAKAEFGARLGSDKFFAEPVASLAWQRTSIDSLAVFGQSVDLENGTGLAGNVGARLGGTFDLKGSAKAVVYARGAWVHEFKGESGLVFQSGGIAEQLSNQRPDDYGQAAIGVNISGTGPMSGFIEGNGIFGNGTSGGGGRVGVRFKF